MKIESTLERITFKKLLQDLSDILNLKRGVLYTLWGLAKNPGKLIHRYLTEERFIIVNSFRILILMVTISTFVSVHYGISDITLDESFHVQVNKDDAKVFKKAGIDLESEFKRLMNQNMSMLQFLLVPFIGVFTYLFFRKSSLNLAEHITAQAYLISFNTFISLLLTPLVFYSVKAYTLVPMLLFLIYHCWFCFSLPSSKKTARKLLASIGSITLGYLVYSILLMLAAGIYIGIKIKSEI